VIQNHDACGGVEYRNQHLDQGRFAGAHLADDAEDAATFLDAVNERSERFFLILAFVEETGICGDFKWFLGQAKLVLVHVMVLTPHEDVSKIERPCSP